MSRRKTEWKLIISSDQSSRTNWKNKIITFLRVASMDVSDNLEYLITLYSFNLMQFNNTFIYFSVN